MWEYFVLFILTGITIFKKSEVSIVVGLHNRYIAQHYTMYCYLCHFCLYNVIITLYIVTIIPCIVTLLSQ